jgi:hypothetical protein
VDEVKLALSKLKGVDDSNVFVKLYLRGEGMTFDTEGAPMIYKRVNKIPDPYGEIPSF